MADPMGKMDGQKGHLHNTHTHNQGQSYCPLEFESFVQIWCF